MIDDKSFKITLIKALEHKANNNPSFGTDKMWDVILALPRCNLYIEETGIFTRKEWNTYCSILHIQVPFNMQDVFSAESGKIFDIADSIYGRQGDNYLTNLDIGILIEKYEVIDFTSISITEVIAKAISDAEIFMGQGKYDSAVDRVHTAFHGYLRKVLENRGVRYEESDTLNQIYNKLHNDICSKMGNTSISDLIRTSMRSASGIITSINDLRNKHSLAHPNDELLKERESLLIIKLVKDLSEYISNIV